MLKPVNDLCKVQLDKESPYGSSNKGTAESGILVELPELFDYIGFWSFAFEDSFMNEEKLGKLHERWTKKIGKRVYWTALSEKGNVIKSGDESYAFVKLTSLIASDDPDSEAYNIHSDGAGAFNAAG